MTNFKLTVVLAAIVVSALLPRLVAAQNCVNGITTSIRGRMTIRVPCRPGTPAPLAGVEAPTAPARPAAGVTGSSGVAISPAWEQLWRNRSNRASPTVGTQVPARPVAPSAAPIGSSWNRLGLTSRFRQPVAASAPVEPPPPPPPALAALPRTDVFQLRMQFVNFRGVRVNEGLPPQGAFCVARTLEDALIDRMTDAQRAERCREWSTALETNGANEYAAPFLLARDGTWVVTRYARVAIGERPWHTQRFQHIDATTSIVQLFPDDVRSGEHDDPPIVVQDTHRLPPSAVASRGHRRGSHAHPRARRSHHGYCVRRACR